MVLPKNLVERFDESLGFYSCIVPTFEQYVIARLIKNGDFENGSTAGWSYRTNAPGLGEGYTELPA